QFQFDLLDNMLLPYKFVQGLKQEKIEQIYRAITYYLANQTEIDNYLQEGELLFQQQREASLQDNQLIIEKINNARQVSA
ncbi:MAG: hypothetical protein AAGA80_28090, partial [Cyanobacteria bacterium P01_F01_bin.143]